MSVLTPQGESYLANLPAHMRRTEAQQAAWEAAKAARWEAGTQRRQAVLGAVGRIAEVATDPEFDAIRTDIRESGCDCLRKFANGYTHEGGLALQQNPDEFAALVLFLQRRRPFGTYLEIGTASGGTTRFLGTRVGFGRMISMDDGRAMRAHEQAVNLGVLPNVTRFVGDSHSPDAREFLATTILGPDIDVAFIDGDHSHAGAWADLEMLLPYCRPGGLVVFHDTRSSDGVEKVWLDGAEQGLFRPLAEFVGETKPLGIGVGEVTPLR